MKVNLRGLLIDGTLPHSKSSVSGSFSATSNLRERLGQKFEHIDLRLHGVIIVGHSAEKVDFIADSYTVGHLVLSTEIEQMFGDVLKKVYREPSVGDLYKHHNGNEYVVTCRANDDSDRPDYPVTIVYSGRNGKVWAKTENNFLQKMTFVRALTKFEVNDFFQG